MLSLFPQLLFLSPFAPFVIRVALALMIGLAAWQHMSKKDALAMSWGIVEIALAVALLVGAWTQAAALLGVVLTSLALLFPRIRIYPRSTELLAIVMLVTLVVTGAGAFALDLPL